MCRSRATCHACTCRTGEPKVSYVSQSDAEGAARWILANRRVELRAYPCPHGAGWHLTSTPAW